MALACAAFALAAHAADPASEAVAPLEEPSEPALTIGDRAEPVAIAPVAVTILDADLLELANVDGLADLELLAPALLVGFQEHLRAAGEGGDGDVLSLVNGLPFAAGLSSSFTYFDVEQIAILRGATLTGAGNGDEGALDVTWRKPSARNEWFGDAGAGNDQWWRLRGAANFAPLGEGDERLTARAALQAEWRGGETSELGSEIDGLGARLSVRSQLTEGSELNLRGHLLHQGSSGFPYSNVRGFDGELTHELGALGALGSLHMRARGGWEETEIDATIVTQLPDETLVFERLEITTEHSAGDLRVETRGGRFGDLALGYFYERANGELGFLETQAPYLTFALRPFESVDSPALSALDFFGGVRWSERRVASRRFGVFRNSSDELLWEVGARLRPAEHHLLWVRYGEEGIVRQRGFEAGWKSAWWLDRIDATAAVFRSSSRHGAGPCPIAPPACVDPPRRFEGTRRWGFEFELGARPSANTFLAASLAYLHGEWWRGVHEPRLPSNAPKWKLTLFGSHRFWFGERGSLTPVFAFVWIDEERLFGERNRRRTDLRLRWDSPRETYWVEAFGENLEDQLHFGLQIDDPRGRTFGARVGFRFSGNGGVREGERGSR